MKTTLVRAFVVALALTGTFAATHAAPTTKVATASAHFNSLPIPTCNPTDPKCTLGN